MRIAITGLLVGVMLAGSALAQDRDALIRNTIQSQIDAFLEDDFATAFTFASPTIESMFGTPENFGRMVREGYPMVWRPAEVRFTGLEERNGRHYQSVLITDGAGQLHLLEYEMVLTAEGWEINGVRFLQPGNLGA